MAIAVQAGRDAFGGSGLFCASDAEPGQLLSCAPLERCLVVQEALPAPPAYWGTCQVDVAEVRRIAWQFCEGPLILASVRCHSHDLESDCYLPVRQSYLASWSCTRSRACSRNLLALWCRSTEGGAPVWASRGSATCHARSCAISATRPYRARIACAPGLRGCRAMPQPAPTGAHGSAACRAPRRSPCPGRRHCRRQIQGVQWRRASGQSSRLTRHGGTRCSGVTHASGGGCVRCCRESRSHVATGLVRLSLAAATV